MTKVTLTGYNTAIDTSTNRTGMFIRWNKMIANQAYVIWDDEEVYFKRDGMGDVNPTLDLELCEVEQ